MAQSSFSRGWSHPGVEVALTRRPPRSIEPRLSLNCPFRMLTNLAAAGAISLWSRPRFSLRTMLIATTLVAIVLGLAVLATR